jgi:hypothetical protein
MLRRPTRALATAPPFATAEQNAHNKFNGVVIAFALPWNQSWPAVRYWGSGHSATRAVLASNDEPEWRGIL